MREMEIFIEETLRILQDNREDIDTIVVLGDVMDRHGILHQKPFHQSCRFLIELSKIRPTYCLIGNHDFDIPSKYLPENHPFKVMTWTTIPNLTVVERPLIVDDVLYTPYVPPGMFERVVREALDLSKEDGTDVWGAMTERGISLVFAHQEFKGCQMGRVKSEVGDPWPEVPFGQVPFVVSGHIHDYQTLGENILYVGTPVQVNYGEGAKKGICLLNFDKTTGYTTNWFKVRVPRKLVRNVPLENLDSWVQTKFEEQCKRYDLELPFTDASSSRKKKTEGFENIGRLLNAGEALRPLREKIAGDRYADHLRLQVKVTGKISGVVVRNVIMKVKELPLGVQQVFIDESAPSDSSSPTTDQNREETHKRGWLEIMMSRIEGSEEKSSVLKELLYNLTQKV